VNIFTDRIEYNIGNDIPEQLKCPTNTTPHRNPLFLFATTGLSDKHQSRKSPKHVVVASLAHGFLLRCNLYDMHLHLKNQEKSPKIMPFFNI
jgi:hypothetical protein